jgi:hypothetical protein
MEIEENEGGGTSVLLFIGDKLSKVPKSHRMLITPELRKAFADPSSYFKDLANRCPFPAMSDWLRAVIAERLWVVGLHHGKPPVPEEWTQVGIRWFGENMLGAEITPASGLASQDLPPVLREYYSLVDAVYWMPFGLAGGLYGCGDHSPLTNFYDSYHGADIDPARTFAFGSSFCGDMLVYTDDGRGGWLCHENAQIHLLGTIEDTINWVYSELRADRCPEYDYNWQ